MLRLTKILSIIYIISLGVINALSSGPENVFVPTSQQEQVYFFTTFAITVFPLVFILAYKIAGAFSEKYNKARLEKYFYISLVWAGIGASAGIESIFPLIFSAVLFSLIKIQVPEGDKKGS